jgi:hypothetical protein
MKINGLTIRLALAAIVVILIFGGGVVTFIKDTVTSQVTLPFKDENNKDIVLQNNGGAKDPTFSQLADFLRRDDTEWQELDVGPALKRIHDNAEAQGIKAGVFVFDTGITISKVSYVDAYVVFHTTDRGNIYVDSTGIYGDEPGDFIFMYYYGGAKGYNTYYIPLENYTKMDYPVNMPLSPELIKETGAIEDSTKMSDEKTIW